MNKNKRIKSYVILLALAFIMTCVLYIGLLITNQNLRENQTPSSPGIYTQIDPPTSTRTIIVLDTSDPRQKQLAREIGLVLQQMQVNPVLNQLQGGTPK